MKSIDENTLYSEFVSLGLQRSRLMADHQPSKANRCFDRMHRLVKERIRQLPDRGLLLLKRVVEIVDDVGTVRVAAAALLPLHEESAIRVLEGVEAEYTIREWKNGNIREYWS